MTCTFQLRVVAMVLLTLGVAEARADGVSLSEQPGHITEAAVVIDASPQEVYDRATDYAHWRDIFSDVDSVTVEGGTPDRARVRFHSRAFRANVTIELANIPGHAIRFKGVKGPPGGRARGEYRLTPIDGGKRTVVNATLYLDVVGPPALFVRDKSIQAMRRTKLQTDLQDLSRWFAARAVSRQRSNASWRAPATHAARSAWPRLL